MYRLALLLLLGSPALLTAQTTTLSTYVAADEAVSGIPVLLGFTVARERTFIGMRWSAAADALSTLSWSDQTTASGLSGLATTEVDAMLFPLGPIRGLPMSPYGFVGAGMRLTRDDDGVAVAGLWSYGGGARTPLSRRLSLETEARYRQPMWSEPAAMPASTAPGLELRVGINLRIGRLADAAAPRPSASAMAGYGRLTRPSAGVPAAASPSEASRLRVAYGAIGAAESHLGTRYVWGGNTPQEGFDCSGFVRYVFQQQGISLPRVSRDQARVGTPVPLDLRALQPGDLIAFASNGRVVDHIAIYAGDNRIIHSSASGGGVRYDDLTTNRGAWYLRHMVAARRVIGASDAFLGAGTR